MSRVLKAIESTCIVCVGAGILTLGIVTVATLVWVMLI